MDLRWYMRRLASMSPREVQGRLVDRARQERWRRALPDQPRQTSDRAASIAQPSGEILQAPNAAALEALVATATDLLEGRWEMFGRMRTDVTAEVDYHWDFVNDRRAPDTDFFSTIDHRNESVVGNVKFIWELARHHHLTVLAAAYSLTGDERYARRTIDEIAHFNRSNPFPMGIHWTSGIEIGIRLESWALIRILLREFPGVSESFEGSEPFVTALGRHHQWIEAFASHGSSANNHLIAELAGHYAAATVFPLFDESTSWADDARQRLVSEFDQQTLPDGHNCELASDYHLLVTELLILPSLLMTHEGSSSATAVQSTMSRALDALASVVDTRLQPPRFSDSDDAFGLLLDPPSATDRVADLLDFGTWFIGGTEWWPQASTAWVRSDVLRQLFPSPLAVSRTTNRTETFRDAGLSVLRSTDGPDELITYFDHGALGYLSTAAHGHADALSIDVRHNGIEVLGDPGTYCYHGEREWRDYFRSTMAHNTVTLGGLNQSDIGGPFLWTRRAEAIVTRPFTRQDSAASITARHDGYSEALGLTHERTLTASADGSQLIVEDRFFGAGHNVPAVVSFHLGPTIDLAHVADHSFRLEWTDGKSLRTAIVRIDASLTTRTHRGSDSSPRSGWYSPVFGTRVPTHTLAAAGNASDGTCFTTIIDFQAENETTAGNEER